jgi:hypothetical protein
MKKIEVSSNREAKTLKPSNKEAKSFSLIFQQKKKLFKLCLLAIVQYIFVSHGLCILNFFINMSTPNVNSSVRLVLKMLKLKTNSQ